MVVGNIGLWSWIKRSLSHQPRSSPPNKTPQIEHPSPRIICPPKRIEQLEITYVCNGTIGKLAVPLVLDLCDLATLVEDVYDRRDGLLHANALDLVASLHVEADGVA
jgi:hypothetical protein